MIKLLKFVVIQKVYLELLLAPLEQKASTLTRNYYSKSVHNSSRQSEKEREGEEIHIVHIIVI